MNIDMRPTAIYLCEQEYKEKTQNGLTKGEILHLAKGNEYYYSASDDFVFLHNLNNPSAPMPWLTHNDFESLVSSKYLKKSNKMPA
ncbi:hypothetical protein N9W34_03235 [Rickettsiales bacterium]|nr:hypothetical protein [Rickettsiales bacterium]